MAAVAQGRIGVKRTLKQFLEMYLACAMLLSGASLAGSVVFHISSKSEWHVDLWMLCNGIMIVTIVIEIIPVLWRGVCINKQVDKQMRRLSSQAVEAAIGATLARNQGESDKSEELARAEQLITSTMGCLSDDKVTLLGIELTPVRLLGYASSAYSAGYVVANKFLSASK